MRKEEIGAAIKSILEDKILLQELPPLEEDYLLGEEGLGLDSLNFLKLLSEIEKELQIKIEDDYWDYARMNTLGKIFSYIRTVQGGT